MPITQQGVPPTALDGTPPVPQMQPQGITGLVQPNQATPLPPELLDGIMRAAANLNQQLDAMAQATKDALPKVAQGFGLVKDVLTAVMKDVQIAGGGSVSNQATGPQFPGSFSSAQPGS